MRDLPEIWRTKAGQEIPIVEMQTSHLFFSVRMIFNHTVPEKYRLPGGERHNYGLSKERSADFMEALLNELMNREDLEPRHEKQLKRIKQSYQSMLNER